MSIDVAVIAVEDTPTAVNESSPDNTANAAFVTVQNLIGRMEYAKQKQEDEKQKQQTGNQQQETANQKQAQDNQKWPAVEKKEAGAEHQPPTWKRQEAARQRQTG